MRSLTRRLRGLIVAIAALALTATVVFAARPATAPPEAAQDGLDRASEVSGKVVPVSAQEDPEAEDDATEDAEEEAEEVEEAVDGDRPMNHGWYVSEAAKGETPDGYDNHGAYVSEVARGDDGKPAASTDEAKAERAAERSAAKAERTAARAAAKAGRSGN